jgi:hypothetical protein
MEPLSADSRQHHDRPVHECDGSSKRVLRLRRDWASCSSAGLPSEACLIRSAKFFFVSYGDRQPIVALRAESPVSKPPAVPIDTVKVDHSFIRGGPGAGIANPQTSKNRRSFEQAS